MRPEMPRPSAITRVLLVAAAGVLLAGCSTHGNTGPTVPLPVVTISPTSASVPVGTPVQFTATVISQTATTLIWKVNDVVGGNSTLGTISTLGLYTAPATVPNPPTVTVKAVSTGESNPFGAAIVTIKPAVSATVAVAPLDSSAAAGTSVQYTATVNVIGSDNTNVTWYVNGVEGGNSTVGTISSSGLYKAPSAAPSPATVAVTATSQADASQSASTTLTVTSSNVAPVFVDFGPNGNTNNPNTAYYNGAFTSVTVCLPSTPVCQTIPNILVDTGSVGLRVLNSQLTLAPSTELGTVKDSAGNQVEECVQFSDTSYTWGPVLIADVGLAGENASHLPIQVIGDTIFPVPNANCLTLGSGPSLDTVEALGANGILGVGNSVQDCGLNCAGGQTFAGYPYYTCPNSVCAPVALPIAQQVANPVAFFTKDNNGVQFIFPSLGDAGAPLIPYVNSDGSGLIPAGLMVFGVGTESNNALGDATLYALDSNGNFPNVIYHGTSYPSGGFLDTGSNALFVSDAQTLGILDCTDNPYYCPASPLALTLIVYGAGGNSGNVGLNIANADQLFGSNPGFSAFNNLGGASGTSVATDYFDLGMPFFIGRTVYVGIAGQAVPGGASAPNGYVAF